MLPVILAFAFTPVSVAVAQDNNRFFAKYVNSAGWPIPGHSGVCKLDDPGPVFKLEFDRLDCGAGKDVSVPKYYLDAEGNLQMQAFQRYAKNLYALAYRGIRYGYTAMMFGVLVASAMNVTWIDEDGSGRFTKLVLGGASADDIPEWAKARAQR